MDHLMASRVHLIFGCLLVLTSTTSFGIASETRSSLSLNITNWSRQKDYEILEYLSFSSKFVPTVLWAETGDYENVNSTDFTINPQCIIDSRLYVQALRNREDWAVSSMTLYL